ncbi:MAG: universal stress protein [Elusimicrobia bacterium]|nr:universal stress protein [Elusimicrobiota bacterium]
MIRFPPRRILVPMGASPESAAAWEQGRILRRQSGAQLEVLHVRPWQPASGELMGAEVWALQAEEAAMRWIHERTGAEAPLHRRDGDPAHAIARFAEEGGFDLIVMGTRGRAGFARALGGSIAESVVRRSKVPTLVVLHPRRRFNSVLAPVSLQPHSLPGARAAAEVAEQFGARLCVLSVIESPVSPGPEALDAVRERQRSLLASIRPSFGCSARVALGGRVEEILREAGRHDLVVLVSHIRRPLRDRLAGTTAERVLRRSPAPVLALPLEPAPAGPSLRQPATGGSK